MSALLLEGSSTQSSRADVDDYTTVSATETTIKSEVKDSLIQNTSILPSCKDQLPRRCFRWNTSEEIYEILTAYSEHLHWLSDQVVCRPVNGSMMLFDRSVVTNYRKDGYIWKKRKDGKHYREDHMKLRVRGTDCIYGSYAHSALLSTFHRRCYYLLDKPDIILVHYLNAPVYGDQTPLPSLKHCDRKQWSKPELIEQLRPMYEAPGGDNHKFPLAVEQLSDSKLESIVEELLARQTRDVTEGVQVAAQWVLSLNHNSPYIQLKPTTVSSSASAVNTSSSHTSSSQNMNKDILRHSCQPIQINGRSIGLLLTAVTQSHHNTNSQLSYINDHTKPVYSVTNTTQPQVNSSLLEGASSLPSHINNINCDIQQSSQLNVQNLPANHLPNKTNDYENLLGNTNYNNQCPGYRNDPSASGSGLKISTVSVSSGEHDSAHESPLLQSQSNTAPDRIVTGSDQILPQFHDNHNCSTGYNYSNSVNDLPMDIGTCLDFEVNDFDLNQSLSLKVDEDGEALTAASSAAVALRKSSAEDLTDGLDLDHIDLFADLASTSYSGYHALDECDMDKPTSITAAATKLKMTALAPEWSYTEGGCKVLIIGPWSSTSSVYSCIFGEEEVKSELVQDGVLACITPAHVEGNVKVKVACDGEVISDSCSFEFRHSLFELSRCRAWFLSEESRLQLALVEQLNYVRSCSNVVDISLPSLDTSADLESRVLTLINYLQLSTSGMTCSYSSARPYHTVYKGMTLTHLAAALGYHKLLEALFNWRDNVDNKLLKDEIHSHSRDSNSCTPMHWCCALGRLQSTLFLYHLDRTTLDDVNQDGISPLHLARTFGHAHIVEEIEFRERRVMESKLDFTASSCRQSDYLLVGSTGLVAPKGRSVSPEPSTSKLHHTPLTRYHSTPIRAMPSTTVAASTAISTLDSGLERPLAATCQFSTPSVSLIRQKTHSEFDDEDSIVDVETVSEPDCSSLNTDIDQSCHRIRLLAEHIIAAIPEHIKSTISEECGNIALLSYRERSSSRSSYSSAFSYAEDSGVCTPLTSDWTDEWNKSLQLSSCSFSPESAYKHHASASSRSDSPPPSAQVLGEYFNTGEGVEYGLSQLTLSDTEQRKLYKAACVIQNAFRVFKDKKQQQREIEAAIVIQTYYRRFKEFTTLRNIQKQQAATRIQSQFRSYYAQKRYKRSRDAALLIQHHYRAYKEHKHYRLRTKNQGVSTSQQKYRTHYNRKKSGLSIESSLEHAPCQQDGSSKSQASNT